MGNTISNKINKIYKSDNLININNVKLEKDNYKIENEINNDYNDDHGYRLNEQSFLLKIIFEEIYKNVFEKVKSNENEDVEILDVGCGTGSWTLAISEEYNDLKFTGIDKCDDFFPKDITLKNCKFKKQNLYDIDDKKYNLIMQIAMSTYLKKDEWSIFLDKYDKILKKNGYVFIIEQNLYITIKKEYNKTLDDYLNFFEELLMSKDVDPKINDNPKLKNMIEERFKLTEYGYKEIKLKDDKICGNVYGKYIRESLKSMSDWLISALKEKGLETNIDTIVDNIIEELSGEAFIGIYYYFAKK